MDKTTQDLAWSVLPKEFKKEVKAHYAGLNAAYKAYLSKDSLSNEECDRCNVLREKMALYQMYFGIDNLTSDAEGDDEMLTVSRKQIDALQGEIFKAIMDAHDADDWQDAAHYILDVMPRSFAALFGSKCLPDEEPLFSNQPENYNNENLIVVSENKPTESTCTDDCPSPCPSQHFDNIINQSFADHNRLHIAAMLAAGMLASEVRCYPVDRALELADKLIAECEKGDNNA